MGIIDALTKRFRPSPTKSYPYSEWGNALPLGFGGQNMDIIFNKGGAAAAFTTIYEVNACVRAVSQAINGLNWNIKHYPDGVTQNEQGEIIGNRGDLKPRHPLAAAFQKFQLVNSMSFLETIALDYELYGEVFIERVDNIFGRNNSLEWLNPLGIQVDYHTGEIVQFRYGWNMDYLRIPVERVAYLHNRNPNNDFIGLPKPLVILNKLNISLNIDRFLRDHFSNNARPGMVMMPTDSENTFSPEDYKRTLNLVREQLQGVGGQYNTVIMQKPMQVETFDQPDIAKNTALTDQQSNAIFEMWGVPRAMLGNTSANPYKDGDETAQRFFWHVVEPLATGVLQPYINNNLMPQYDSSGETIFEFDVSKFDTVTNADMLEAQVIDIQSKGTLIDLYTAAKQQEIEPDDRLKGLYMVEGIPVPVEELSTYWEKQMLVAPSVYGAEEITGEPLPQPVPPEEVIPTAEGGEPVADESTRVEAETAQVESDEIRDTVEDTARDEEPDKALPHYKLYEGDDLFPSEDEIEARLAKELKAWGRFEGERVSGRKQRTREFETDIIPPWIRYEIIDRLEHCKSKSSVLNMFDKILTYSSVKTVSSYQRELRDLARGLWNDSLSVGQFSTALDATIQREYKNAFTEGVHRANLSVADLTDDERGELDELIANEQQYVDQLSFYIYDNRKGKGKLQAVRSRVDKWVARYLSVRETGFMVAKRVEPLQWRWNPRKEHCKDCENLNGRVYRAATWRKMNIAPQSPRLQCFGIYCGCALTDTDQPLTKGRPPKIIGPKR